MRRTTRSVSAAVSGLLAAGSLVVVGAAAPTYAAVPAGCSSTTPTCTTTFVYTGAEQTYTVPSGVTSVRVTAVGARGGGSSAGDAGGRGASVSGTVSVPAGATLYVAVGETQDTSAATTPGTGRSSFNGGGAPGYNTEAGAGGGASDVRTMPRAAGAASLDSRLVVAAGGGGAAANYGSASSPGGDAGAAGVPQAGATTDGFGGGAGSGTQGGAPGRPGTRDDGLQSAPGQAGALGQGGSGGRGFPSGGGGGGGLFGGGGGGGGYLFTAHAGSGGGGSSLVPPAGTSMLSTTPASVTISYDRTAIAPTIPPATSGTYGTPVQITATLDGTSVPGDATFAFTLDGSVRAPCAAVPAVPTPQAGDDALQAVCTFTDLEPGSYLVQAEFSGNTAFAPQPSNIATLTIGRASQTVTFTSTAPSAAVVGDTYAATAMASSGAPVAFSSITPSVCTVSVSGAVTLDHAGTCTVQAYQSGTNHELAASARQSFAVGRGAQSVMFTSTAPAASAVGDTYTATATATSGGPVTFSSGSPDVCTVSATGAVRSTGAGTCTVLADQTGTVDRAPAPRASQSFAVTRVAQSTSFTSSPPTGATVGGTYAAAATASSGGSVTFSSGSPSVCTVGSTGSVQFTGAGTCRVLADQPGDATYQPAPQAVQTVAVAALPAPVPAVRLADLGVTFMSKAPDWARAGSVVRIDLDTRDAGPSTATAAITTMTLPKGWKVRRTSDGTVVRGRVLTVTGDLASGATRSSYVVLTVGPRARATVKATVASTVPDPAPADNTAQLRSTRGRR